MIAFALVAMQCNTKSSDNYDNNRAEAAETEGQRDKDNAETNEEAERDTAGIRSATGINRESDDQQFAMKAAEAGLTEVRLGELAVNRAQASNVKEFARRMVEDHTTANNELKNLARTKNITLPTDCKCQSKVDELSNLSGQAFDSRYTEMMVADHEKAVQDFKTESSQGKDNDLKSWAAQKLPLLEHHLSMAKTMSATARN